METEILYEATEVSVDSLREQSNVVQLTDAHLRDQGPCIVVGKECSEQEQANMIGAV